jgi:membrane-associated protease RseP (regulator of RpoE activity)
VAGVLFLFVAINVFIGLLNLFPALPFDGGHVVIAVYEKVREWLRPAKVRYLADVTKMMPVTYTIILLLGFIFVSSIYLDIINPISVK